MTSKLKYMDLSLKSFNANECLPIWKENFLLALGEDRMVVGWRLLHSSTNLGKWLNKVLSWVEEEVIPLICYES